MSFGLQGRHGHFGANNFCWTSLLLLAHRYGWKPAGTTLSEEFLRAEMKGGKLKGRSLDEAIATAKTAWQGTYFSNDLQCVSDEDAIGIADALSRAFPDLPEAEQELKMTVLEHPDGGSLTYPDLKCDATVMAVFSGANRTYVKEFIAFCRRGGFCIC